MEKPPLLTGKGCEALNIYTTILYALSKIQLFVGMNKFPETLVKVLLFPKISWSIGHILNTSSGTPIRVWIQSFFPVLLKPVAYERSKSVVRTGFSPLVQCLSSEVGAFTADNNYTRFFSCFELIKEFQHVRMFLRCLQICILVMIGGMTLSNSSKAIKSL